MPRSGQLTWPSLVPVAGEDSLADLQLSEEHPQWQKTNANESPSSRDLRMQRD